MLHTTFNTLPIAYQWGCMEHWENVNKIIVIMDGVEKQANKKYEQLTLEVRQTPNTSRLLNEMEDNASSRSYGKYITYVEWGDCLIICLHVFPYDACTTHAPPHALGHIGELLGLVGEA